MEGWEGNRSTKTSLFTWAAGSGAGARAQCGGEEAPLDGRFLGLWLPTGRW